MVILKLKKKLQEKFLAEPFFVQTKAFSKNTCKKRNIITKFKYRNFCVFFSNFQNSPTNLFLLDICLTLENIWEVGLFVDAISCTRLQFRRDSRGQRKPTFISHKIIYLFVIVEKEENYVTESLYLEPVNCRIWTRNY